MDGITRVLLVHNIFWGLFYAKGSTGEIGEDGYKVSKLDCGGLVANEMARHLGGLGYQNGNESCVVWS
jgi:hypothetical protein